MIDVQKLYNTRFTSFERVKKNELWRILCRDFLQKYIMPNDSVIDLGAGNCEFINNIKARKKFAVDINSDVKFKADKDVEVRIAPIKYIKNIFPSKSIDAVFMSNLLEHLDNKEEVFRLLNETFIVLKKGGRILIMQPDISLVGGQYWDFFDHKVPLTFASLTEVLLSIGYKIADFRYPFLPYSTKVRFLPLYPWLLRIYLRLRPLHYLFGKQFFICAQK